MALEMYFDIDPAENPYALIYQGATVYDGSGMVNYDAGDWADYVVQTPQLAGSIHGADFPALPAGAYLVLVYRQLGASPAATDPVARRMEIVWTGTGEATLQAIQSKVNLITAEGVSVTVQSPVIAEGEIELIRGDDYADMLGNAIRLTVAGLPLISQCYLSSSAGLTAVEGQVEVDETADEQQLVFELTSAQTTLLNVGQHDYDVEVVFSTGQIRTLGRGTMTVRQDQTRRL